MNNMNTTRDAPRDKDSETNNDMEFFLKHAFKTEDVAKILRSRKMADNEINAYLEKYEIARKKVGKVVGKFLEKIQTKYPHLDVPELVQKGLKFAVKNGLSAVEKDAFIRRVMNHDSNVEYNPFKEVESTDMSKFLGFSNMVAPTLDMKAQDQASLQEIARNYELNKRLYAAARSSSEKYKGCDQQVFMARFDASKNNVHLYIDPTIIALFVPKFECFEKRMIIANFGRMLVQRAQQYLTKYSPMIDSFTKEDLTADLELAFNIARDPNSLEYLSDETPMLNLLKRQRVQVALWKVILMLRQGKVYSNNDFSSLGSDGITDLTAYLSEYEWAAFDSPESSRGFTEINTLRKLLSVFAFRPTMIQMTAGAGIVPGGPVTASYIAGVSYVNVRVINVRIPTTTTGTGSVSLSTALTGGDWFVIDKRIVPRNRSVLSSNDVAIFVVNRRQTAVPSTSGDIGFAAITMNAMMPVGVTMLNDNAINKAMVTIEHSTRNPINVMNFNNAKAGETSFAVKLSIRESHYELVSSIVAAGDKLSEGCETYLFSMTNACNYKTTGTPAPGGFVARYAPRRGTDLYYTTTTPGATAPSKLEDIKNFTPYSIITNESEILLNLQTKSLAFVFAERKEKDQKTQFPYFTNPTS